MAIVPIDGLTGSITLPNGLVQWISGVSLSAGADLLDVSHYPLTGTVGGYRDRIVGIKDLAGQCVAFMTEGTAGTMPFNLSNVPGTMTLQFSSGCGITFSAVIGNVQIVGEYTGLNIITFSFSHSGADASDIQPFWNFTS